MLTMDDIVSWLQSEEEIKVLGYRFFTAFFDEYLTEYIIREYDILLIILYPCATDHLRRGHFSDRWEGKFIVFDKVTERTGISSIYRYIDARISQYCLQVNDRDDLRDCSRDTNSIRDDEVSHMNTRMSQKCFLILNKITSRNDD